MLESESRTLTLSGQSDSPVPVDALREALSGLAKALVGAGAAPYHMTAMRLRAADPSQFDMGIHAIDLCYREIFGGFRPTVTPGQGGDGLTVEADVRIPLHRASKPVWHGLTVADVAKEYSPRNQVLDMGTVFAQWTRDGSAFLQRHPPKEISYGKSEYETLDLFMPDSANRPPLWIFIHGGYWQASDKAQHAQFLAGMLGAGYAVANLNYQLAPQASLDGIVTQVREAIALLAREAGALGFDERALHVAGHSAGGHLAAMVATDEQAPEIRSALLLSGLFELEPLSYLPVASLLGLSSPEAVARLSPLRMRPRAGVKIGVSLGALESKEFLWQSEKIAQAWQTLPLLVVPEANHFNLLDGLIDGELLALACQTAA
jgi:arylformamidase